MDLSDRRIKMDDIKQHAWYTSEDVPTEEEIKEEFKTRDEKVKKALDEERKQKKLE